MSDCLVKLYDVDFGSIAWPIQGIRIIVPMQPNMTHVVEFVKANFNQLWADEMMGCFCKQPISCYIAVNNDDEIIGFACYESTAKNFFGPCGVLPQYRKRGIGERLLLCCLQSMRNLGYHYCIIGSIAEGSFPFYAKVCNATIIANSDKGAYDNLLSSKS